MVERRRAAAAPSSRAGRPSVGYGPELLYLVLLHPAKPRRKRWRVRGGRVAGMNMGGAKCAGTAAKNGRNQAHHWAHLMQQQKGIVYKHKQPAGGTITCVQQ